MQYHLNGFRVGDPAIAPAAAHTGRPAGDVDVLIVGAGPAGLTLAAQLAAFPNITTRLVERKADRLRLGQADGIACRTMEMFEAFGFSDRVMREAYWVNETTFWRPDDTNRDHIVRSGRIQDTEDGLSEFPHTILNQARVHDFFLETMANAPARLAPSYSRAMAGFDDAGDGTLIVRLERLDPGHESEVETVRTRYLVGCDGARSAVRRALGHRLVGEAANHAWGVMDVLAVTDFPDVRFKCAIHSANEGNILIIPREGGYLVRFYIELDKLNPDERVADRAIGIDQLIAAAQRILDPYTLEVKEVAWWSIYEIGQRLCDSFDDSGGPGGKDPKVFIAGDACHTHSPKAGQGMNVSMQDAFNLGWKLASVIDGRCRPEILRSYSAERQAVARELIDFDRTFAAMFSAAPIAGNAGSEDGVDPAAFQSYFVRQGRFTAGTATCYGPSLIRGDAHCQALAKGFVIGTRFHSAPVVRLADARAMQLGHVVKADGRWRLFLFAPSADPFAPHGGLAQCCDWLDSAAQSPIVRYTRAGDDIDSVFDVRAILQQRGEAAIAGDVPSLLQPRKGRYGLKDYEKLFYAERGGQGDIFDLRQIDRASGCVVALRPDQYIANIFRLEDCRSLAGFFDGFMLQPG